ncbi:MAG: hypothetical protein ABIH08_06585 [Candidatus Omnitrophota bacterium]
MPKAAQIVMPISLNREFDYSIPAGIKIQEGLRVFVDFNGKKRVGLVAGLSRESKIKNLKPIIKVLDRTPSLSKDHIQFAGRLSKMYPYPPAEFLFMMLPSYLKKPNSYIKMCRGGACLCPLACARRGMPEGVLQNIKEESISSEPEFIRADNFAQRYKLWKPVVEEKLKQGSVLVCFPQLSYLMAAKQLLEKDFGSQLQVIHSQIKEKNLFDAWCKSRANTLILGTRVAIFYYPDDLKLIVMEEENSPYYFQEEKPYHNLLDVALTLSQFKKTDLILSSDFPSLAAYKLIKDKKMSLRNYSGPEKKIRIISIPEFNKKKIISPVLVELLRKNIQAGASSVVLWNRKGYGRVVLCSACGHIFKCERCSGFLRLSLKETEGICPYCQGKTILPKICNHCNSGYVKSGGYGIEKIESFLKRSFPEAKVDSWDTRQPDSKIILSTSKIISFLYEGQTFDSGFVLDTDSFLARPEYEAVFSTFLYLKKLCFFFKDTLHIFTGNKDYYLFQYLSRPWQDFYEYELSLRKKLNLPPFGLIIKIILRSKNKNKLLKQAQDLYNKLGKKFQEIYGPAEEEPFKLRDKFRYFIIVKAQQSIASKKMIKEELKGFRSSSVQLAVSLK